MRDIDHGQAKFLLQVADFVPHRATKFGIKVGKRFIKQQHLWFKNQRARHRDTLLLPS